MQHNVIVIIFQGLEEAFSNDSSDDPRVVVRPVPGPLGLLGFPQDVLKDTEGLEDVAIRIASEQTGLLLDQSQLYSVETVEKEGVLTTAFTLDLPEVGTAPTRLAREVDIHAQQNPQAYSAGFAAWLSLAADTVLG